MMKIFLLLFTVVQFTFAFDHLVFNTKTKNIIVPGGGEVIFKGKAESYSKITYYAIIDKKIFFEKYEFCTLGGMRADIKGSTCKFGWYDGDKKTKIFFKQLGEYSECNWICK